MVQHGQRRAVGASRVLQHAGVLQQKYEFPAGGVERVQHLLARSGAVQRVEHGGVPRREPAEDDRPYRIDTDLQGGPVTPEAAQAGLEDGAHRVLLHGR